MMLKCTKKGKGFTLVELLLALAITVVIFSLLGPFLVTGINSFAKSNSMVVGQSNLRRVMVSISREMRDATSVTVDSDLPTQVEIDDNTYYFDNDAGTIVKTTSTGDEVVIAEYVTLFNVTKTDDLVTLQTQAANESSFVVTKVYLRSRPVPTET